MPKKPKPHGLPTNLELHPLDAGKDNSVWDLLNPAPKPHLRTSAGVVLKLNHLNSAATLKHTAEGRVYEGNWENLRYKKEKYEILRHFLGDFIPKSAFVFANAREKGREEVRQMVFQEKLPKSTMQTLTLEQKKDPRLLANMNELVHRLRYMYKMIGEANGRTTPPYHLDAKLDLGGISDAVRAESMDIDFTPERLEELVQTNTSPNIMVNPETLEVHCVDFDEGTWNDGMSHTKEILFALDAREKQKTLGTHAAHRA